MIRDHYDEKHSVYLHRAADGRVLYVGITIDLKKRTATHRSHSPWWGQVASVEVESLQPDNGTARVRERALIRQYEPPNNRDGNPARDREDEAWQIIARRYGVIGAMDLLGERTAVQTLALLYGAVA